MYSSFMLICVELKRAYGASQSHTSKFPAAEDAAIGAFALIR